tara:strand:+ start:10119 stop:10256 length:138 start_codon:yes stop_codon:yes gene_type:complete
LNKKKKKKTTHRTWSYLIKKIVPEGEKGRHWWLYSWLMNNRTLKK